jgi:undecaprenyl-phosphate 4-deoxy-4-formamido-L-arabinose transferase
MSGLAPTLVLVKWRVSVVVPTYRSPNTLSRLVDEIVSATWWNDDFEIIIVDDGNVDGTWAALQSITATHQCVRAMRLSRNFGQHAALLAGIREARNQIVVTLDDDLQNPPAETEKLLSALRDDVDVVYGTPRVVGQGAWRRFSSALSKYLMKVSLGFEHAEHISSFRAFRTSLRDGFAENLGPGVSIDAMLNWSTTRFTNVEVEHRSRESGTSNYNFWKLLRFMFDTATGYSTAPLRAATGLGLVTVLLSIGVLVWVVGRPLVTGDAVPGFPFLAATIAIFSGTQLIVLGVLGQYLGRMHFRVMNKPSYTIADRIGT